MIDQNADESAVVIPSPGRKATRAGSADGFHPTTLRFPFIVESRQNRDDLLLADALLIGTMAPA